MEYFTKGEHLKVWIAVRRRDRAAEGRRPRLVRRRHRRAIVAKTIVDAPRRPLRRLGPDAGRCRRGLGWKELTDWISGTDDLDTALKNIDASWPK